MTVSRMIVAGLVASFFPAMVSAENIEVLPLAWDFGEVEVGESASKTFEILGAGTFFDSEIGRIEISDDLFGVYSLFDTPPPGTFIAPGEMVQFGVRFSPSTTREFTATLEIPSSDLRWPDLDIPLRGRSISGVVPEPGSLIVWALFGLGAAGLRRCWKSS